MTNASNGNERFLRRCSLFSRATFFPNILHKLQGVSKLSLIIDVNVNNVLKVYLFF